MKFINNRVNNRNDEKLFNINIKYNIFIKYNVLFFSRN